VLSRLSEAVDLLVEQTKELERRLLNLEEYVEELDEDLEELEELFVDDEDEEGEEETVEITCPECGEEVLVDVEDLEDETLELLCPKCHTVLVMEDAEGKLDEVTKENGD
jgi:Zn finger protein HypA/HybF involved in hydrogenase expression